jgi:hypothetical protein
MHGGFKASLWSSLAQAAFGKRDFPIQAGVPDGAKAAAPGDAACPRKSLSFH